MADDISVLDRIEPNRQMGPPPADKAQTNRMSPAGIPYLYLASDLITAMRECRIEADKHAVVARFVSTKRLHVLDLSKNTYYMFSSIFDPQYDHDKTWMSSFWEGFIKEISEPVSDEKQDHSYEYAATQLVAEYYKIKGYDGMCYKSSVGEGKNYVFFVGPDPAY